MARGKEDQQRNLDRRGKGPHWNNGTGKRARWRWRKAKGGIKLGPIKSEIKLRARGQSQRDTGH